MMKTRKELKEDYKQHSAPMGIFQIKNLVNNKIFIGSSNNLNAIWNRQKMQLKTGAHPNRELQADWRAFGEDNFSYEIIAALEKDDDKKLDYSRELKALEELYLEELIPYGDNGYNKRPV